MLSAVAEHNVDVFDSKFQKHNTTRIHLEENPDVSRDLERARGKMLLWAIKDIRERFVLLCVLYDLNIMYRVLESCAGGRPIQKEAGRRHCLLLKDILLATRTSWEREYKGGVANQLWKYIKEHFNTSLTSTTYPYYVAIVQSSGQISGSG